MTARRLITYKYPLLVLALFFHLYCTPVSASTQYWPSAGITWDANGPWTMEFSETYYYHVSNSAADFTKSDFAASYTGLSENYDLGLGFAYLSPSNTEDEENRPYVLATIKGKLLNVEASNRSIIEYRMQAGLHDSWRFRDKIQITDPLEAFNSRHKNRKEKRIVPFIFDEMFVSSNGEGFDQNRASAGVQIKLTKNAVTGVYYMLLTEKDAGRWSNSNVIGIDLIYEF